MITAGICFRWMPDTMPCLHGNGPKASWLLILYTMQHTVGIWLAHLNSGNIWIAHFYLFVIQIVRSSFWLMTSFKMVRLKKRPSVSILVHFEQWNIGSWLRPVCVLACPNNRPVFKWWSKYRSVNQMVIWISKYHGTELLNNKLFDQRTNPHDLNTKLVFYLDPHCTVHASQSSVLLVLSQDFTKHLTYICFSSLSDPVVV